MDHKFPEDETDPAKMKKLLAAMSPGQEDRFEQARRARFKPNHLKKLAVIADRGPLDDGGAVVLVAPGSDVLSVLEASLRGRKLTDHFALAFQPGEVRYVGDMGDARPWAPRRPS